MRNKIEEIVLAGYKQVIEENNMCVEASIKNTVTREMGLNSSSIVEFIMFVEEKLDINLDSVLKEIRNCKIVEDIVDVVEKEFSNQ